MPAERAPDVIIIGDGVIGLSTALELARAGARAHIVGVRHEGSASGAAAGLLAPSIGRLEPLVRELFDSSLSRYPEFIRRLQQFDASLALIEGLVQVATTLPSVESAPRALRLDAKGIAQIEPALTAPSGGLFHPTDAAIDNVRLMAALWRAVEYEPGLTVTRDDPVGHVAVDADRARVQTRRGDWLDGDCVVLAAGAWSTRLTGLPRSLPVVPLKGQMLALRAAPLRHPVAGDSVYLVPRGDEVVVGATVEHAGFDIGTDTAAIEGLRVAAAALCPSLADAPISRQWAGIRPATPDLLPIVGRDPDAPRLIYACGHSKNGILLAPETAVAVTRLAQGAASDARLERLSVARFGGQNAVTF